MRRATVWMALGVLGLCLGLIGTAVSLRYAWYWERDYVDATPAELMDAARVPTGTVVCLRSLRDRSHAVTLASGRVLYPALGDARVLVDCEVDGCDGPLVGAVEELVVETPVPSSWPEGVPHVVRVVRDGWPGPLVAANARRASVFAALAFVLGVSSLAVAIVLARARPRFGSP